MLNELLIKRLRDIVGAANISTSTVDRLTHCFDATQRRFLPEVVIHPGSTEEVSRIVCLANEAKIPILPRGAGSGFSGGSLPIHGGIVLVMTRMNRILEIDSDNLIAVVEPGVVTADLQRAVERIGLFYPPDPASKDFSTLGGNVAECAGGPRCVKYGVTRDYVLGLTVVTPTGDIIHTGGRTMKNVVGYDLTNTRLARAIHRADGSPHRIIAPDELADGLAVAGFTEITIHPTWQGHLMRFHAYRPSAS